MCGRFTLNTTPDQVATLFDLPTEPRLQPRYNIAPTQPVGIVRMDKTGDAREWELVTWGLVPSWSKDPSMGARMINARSETAREKPSFRAAFKRRRCLVPATGFYEWQKVNGKKQPHLAGVKSQAKHGDSDLFAFAGLWEFWTGGDGSEIQSCTILTTSPNELMEPIHNRMPVILHPDDYEEWLGSGQDDPPPVLDSLQHLLRPFPTEQMQTTPISTLVNNPRNENAECIEPLTV